jgi:hypothetical protein
VGVIILANSRTELSVAGNNRLGREAFNAADSCARIAILMSLLVFHPELGSPSQALKASGGPSPKIPLTVDIDTNKLNLANITTGSHEADFVQRYLKAGLGGGQAAEEPHITFRVGSKVVAMAVLSVEKSEIIPPGASISEGSSYEGSNGYKYKIQMITTVKGSTNAASFKGTEEPNAVITAMYREFTN